MMPILDSFPINYFLETVNKQGTGQIRIEKLDETNNKIIIVAKFFCNFGDGVTEEPYDPFKGYFAEAHMTFDLDAFRVWLRQCSEEVGI